MRFRNHLVGLASLVILTQACGEGAPEGGEIRTPEGPEAEGRAILERSAEAHGGLQTFRAIRSWRIVARREGRTIPVGEIYEEYIQNAGTIQTLLIKRQPGTVLTYLHDGQEGYSLVDGRLLEDAGAAEEAYYRAHGEYYLRALPFKWLDPGVSHRLVGRETVRGTPALLVEIQAEEGVGDAWQDTWTAVIDSNSHLLIEGRLEHYPPQFGQGPVDPEARTTSQITYRYSDYRQVDGLRIPFVMEYVSGDEVTGENVIQEIELDLGLDPELFTPEAHRVRAPDSEV